ncbi:MAG: chemotaxis protein CheW [Oceanobacter sp.]
MTATEATTLDATAQDEQQYLTFIMAEEEYGVDILAVQEIRGWEESTLIPNAPDYLKGVINLRGTIVPIMDLRLRFGLPKVEYSPVTVVIILKMDDSSSSRVMGIVVDAVSDVYTISSGNTRKAPELSEDENSEFIRGLVNVNEKMVILLDVASLLRLSDSIPGV